MQTFFSNIGIKVPEIYLPTAGTDFSKWAVVACDQYTSEPEYRQKVQEIIGNDPSTFNITFPEVYLEDAYKKERIQRIQSYMKKYLDENILQNQGTGFVLVDRKTSHTESRKGLIVALDLECYDYSKESQTLIRATEGTIIDRLPPRIEIRKDAPLELPHIMVLIDDPQRTVIEPLFAKTSEYKKLYDTDLMQNGGYITGYQIADEASITTIVHALEHLADKNVFEKKYGVGEDKGVLLFAMGDGNHSLATAKAIREEKKKGLSEEEKVDCPARFALVELVNIHDTGLVFEPIHRVLFHVDEVELMKSMKTYFANQGSELEITSYPSKEDMKKGPCTEIGKGAPADKHIFWAVSPSGYSCITLNHPKLNLEVGNLQAFLDSYLKVSPESKIDYVHGENVTEQLGSKEGNMGFILPIMDKSAFFKTVIVDGALPRKTFSMGEAEEKRFYMECRKIIV